MTAAIFAVVAIAGAMVGGCGKGSAGPTPTAALAATSAEQTNFQRLLADWARASQGGRIALEPRIAEFRERYRKSELAYAAEVLLAWVALEKGDLAVAGARARRVQAAAGPGTTSDLARTVEGAALRRGGKPEQALDLLTPLVGKLVDAYARALLNEEVVESALAAKRWQRALRLMGQWLREAGPDEQAGVRAKVERGLARVPSEELERLLGRARSIEVALAAEEELEIRRLVALRLADVAREKRDVELAQRLISQAGALLGDRGDAIAELAAGVNKARVEARTVGLLLSLRSDETRRRGAEVAAGVAFGLGLPGSSARLVSRDDRGSEAKIEDALASLSADGASIVIAGCDAIEAAAAARFAESRRIPVLLLQAPSKDDEAGRGSAEGVPRKEDEDRSQTPRGGAKPRSEAAATGRFSFVVGTADGGAVSAGLFPVDPRSPPPALQPWVKARSTPPSFWAALGHDAAVLAWAGVQGLPAQGTEDPAEVAARRAKAAAELARAEAELWTTEARGFGGGRSLPRTIAARERPAPRK